MSGPGAGAFRRVAHRIVEALQKATNAIGGHDYQRAAHGLRDAATGAARTDPESAAQIGRASRRFWGPRLYGIDANGKVVSFRPRHVHSIQLNDATGKPIGVLFPTKPNDAVGFREWASAPIRGSDRWYKFSNAGKDDPPIFAPWAQETEAGRPPTYIIAHGTPDTFAVTIEKGKGPAIKVRLDGTSFGRLVAADQHFRRAAELAHTQNSKVAIACITGHPEGVAAEWMAEYLHGSGAVKGDIYAPTGDAAVYKPGTLDGFENESALVVDPALDEEGKRIPAFLKFPASSEPPTT